MLRMRELYLHNIGVLMRRRKELSAIIKVRCLEMAERMLHPRVSSRVSCLPLLSRQWTASEHLLHNTAALAFPCSVRCMFLCMAGLLVLSGGHHTTRTLPLTLTPPAGLRARVAGAAAGAGAPHAHGDGLGEPPRHVASGADLCISGALTSLSSWHDVDHA